MIVDSMTASDTVKALKKEIWTLDIKGMAKKFGSEVLSKHRKTDFPLVRTYNRMSKGKIQCYITFRAEKRGRWDNPEMLIAGSYLLSDGQYGFLLCPSLINYQQEIFILTPHFLRRYRERVLENTGIVTEMVIKEFVLRNKSFSGRKLLEKHSRNMERYEREGICQMAIITDEGYCIAETDRRGCSVMRTFLTNDMLSLTQKEQFGKDRDKNDRIKQIIEMYS